MTALLDQARAADPEVFAWLEAHKHNEFAGSLLGYAARKGTLSDGQRRAVLNSIERDKVPAPTVDTGQIEAVFARATGKGLKKPALQIGQFRFSPAPAAGANPGAIYVKDDGAYLGKMLNGKFLARATAEVTARVLAIAADPLGEAVKHGKLTGRCAICSRLLTQESSVERAMGKVCYDRFFGA